MLGNARNLHVIYVLERHVGGRGGVMAELKMCCTSGQSPAICSDAFLALARADELALAHE